MKTGSFEAMGNEYPRPTSFLRVVPLGALVASVAWLLVLPLVGRYFLPTNIFYLFYAYSFDYYLLGLLFVLLVGFLVYDRIKYNHNSTYKISYTDNTDEGGNVEIQYVDLSNAKSKSMEIRRVKAQPDMPLRVLRGSLIFNVKATSCSVQIVPVRGNFFLTLGFETIEEMNKVVALLGGHGEVSVGTR